MPGLPRSAPCSPQQATIAPQIQQKGIDNKVGSDSQATEAGSLIQAFRKQQSPSSMRFSIPRYRRGRSRCETISSSSSSCPNLLFKPFKWPNHDEATDRAAAIEHLKRLLSEAGVAFKRDGFKLVDVHSDKNLLNSPLSSPSWSATSSGSYCFMLCYSSFQETNRKLSCPPGQGRSPRI